MTTGVKGLPGVNLFDDVADVDGGRRELPASQQEATPSPVTVKRKKTLRMISKGLVRIHNVVRRLSRFSEAIRKGSESPELFPLDYTNAGNDLIHMGFMPMGVNSAVSQSE